MIRTENVEEYGTSQLGQGSQRDATDGELVVVHPAVLATTDHAFGNLFQRVYHLIRTARVGGDATIVSLEESVHELQLLLELFVDYVAPTAVASRPLRGLDLIVSCRGHLEDEIGPGRVSLVADELAGNVLVTIDPAHMARVFQLLSRCLKRAVDGGGALAGSAGISPDGSAVQLAFTTLPDRGVAADELRWALAQKLIDLQGGELRESVGPVGREWTLRLPISSS